MNYLSKKISPIFIIVSIIMLPLFLLASDKIPIETATIFNTLCAQCHEGECSGRMSFHLPKKSADQHIHRHGGELSQAKVGQLFELLRYMKEECSFYPFELALVKDRVWGSDTLAKLHSPSNLFYFMHLGLLEPGSYQLLFTEANNNFNFCIEVINKEFDFIDCENINGTHNQKKQEFQVTERSKYFLRIKARKPINLIRLELLGPIKE
ncbi:MAG: hypothetical protein IME94_09360 [Proteobacteria bacterium]|nr:hypothetical protein [Pseudomonadota bacterium]